MSFGGRLKALRERDKLTGEALGEKLGLSKQTVSHWEHGRYEPNLEQIGQLCALFRVSADELIRGVKPERQADETPFRSLDTFEAQLVSFFRMLKPDIQHEVLIALNDIIPKERASTKADPFPGKRVKRGLSRLGELSPTDTKIKGAKE